MNFEDLKDKNISLIVWNTEKEDDVHVYLGRLHFENECYYFVNQERGWRLSLDEEHLNRLKLVANNLKETLLNADYALSMSIASLPESDAEDFINTGMKWHE